jgi:tetratricopeptide (TPR) repeat protein
MACRAPLRTIHGRGAAYAYIYDHPNDLAAAYKAYAIAIPHVQRSICAPQYINLHYILAQCAREMGDPRLAFEMLDMLDRALERSTQLHDRRSTAELLYIAGNTRRGYMQPRAALSDLRASQAIIADLKGSEVTAEPQLELNVAFAIAGVAFFQARYEDALPLLEEAHSLHLTARNLDVEQDHIAWMRAVLLRYLGRADEALPILQDVATRIDAMANPAMCTRLYGALADAAVDLAARARDRGEDRIMRQLLSIAQTHTIEGVTRCDTAFDEGGAMLARLAIVRQSQFVEDSDACRDIIAAAWRFAENTVEYDVKTRASPWRASKSRKAMSRRRITCCDRSLAEAPSARFPTPASRRRRYCGASAAMRTGKRDRCAVQTPGRV